MASCAQCLQPLAEPKRCSKCKGAAYCGRECQKAHWKAHKPTCKVSVLQQDKDASSPQMQVAKPFTAISRNTFLHDMSKEQTFRVLIDCLRLRRADDYNLEGKRLEGSIYSGHASSEQAFRTFLTKVQQVEGFLPSWWTADEADACVQYGLQEGQHFSLTRKTEKAGVQKQWNDDLMPMKLRMLGEKVFGTGPGGSDGSAMMRMQMAQEQGQMAGMHTSHLDIAL